MGAADNKAVRVYGKTRERKELARTARRQQDKDAERKSIFERQLEIIREMK